MPTGCDHDDAGLVMPFLRITARIYASVGLNLVDTMIQSPVDGQHCLSPAQKTMLALRMDRHDRDRTAQGGRNQLETAASIRNRRCARSLRTLARRQRATAQRCGTCSPASGALDRLEIARLAQLYLHVERADPVSAVSGRLVDRGRHRQRQRRWYHPCHCRAGEG